MNRETISQAMGELSEAYVAEAICYRKARKKWLLPLSVAACAAVICLIFLPKRPAPAADSEPVIVLTREEALKTEPFGQYYPSWMPEGYEVSGDGIGLYGTDGSVLSASYYSEEYQDELIIRIAEKSWFETEVWNTVLYTDTTAGVHSRIYIDGGAYGVFYYSSGRDIAAMEGFERMVRSAVYFADVQTGYYRMDTQSDFESFTLPALILEEDGSFVLNYDLLSSYLPRGRYTIRDGCLQAVTDDGRCQYVFAIIDSQTLAFDAKSSSDVSVISRGFSEPISDGAVFRLEES